MVTFDVGSFLGGFLGAAGAVAAVAIAFYLQKSRTIYDGFQDMTIRASLFLMELSRYANKSEFPMVESARKEVSSRYESFISSLLFLVNELPERGKTLKIKKAISENLPILNMSFWNFEDAYDGGSGREARTHLGALHLKILEFLEGIGVEDKSL